MHISKFRLIISLSNSWQRYTPAFRFNSPKVHYPRYDNSEQTQIEHYHFYSINIQTCIAILYIHSIKICRNDVILRVNIKFPPGNEYNLERLLRIRQTFLLLIFFLQGTRLLIDLLKLLFDKKIYCATFEQKIFVLFFVLRKNQFLMCFNQVKKNITPYCV